MRVSDEAWILHVRPWRESSVLLELITGNHGRVSGILKGGRSVRRGRAAPQQLIPMQISWSGNRELKSIWVCEEKGSSFTVNGVALLAGLYLNELLLRVLPPGDPCPQIYQAYCRAVTTFASEADDCRRALCDFEFELLSELGYGLDWNRESVSGRRIVAEAVYKLDSRNGFVAVTENSDSAAEGFFSGSILSLIAAGQYTVNREVWKLSRRIVNQMLSDILRGRKLRSWQLWPALTGQY